MSVGTWILERGESERFPYRIQLIDSRGNTVLALRAQDRWPAANRNIFCLRDQTGPAPREQFDEVERVEVLALRQRGVRISIVLDRPRYRRCDFLFLQRQYKGRPGESYEQIFWQTQASMTQRRPKVAPASLRGRREMTVVIDSGERYPWRFAGCAIERRRLDCGDYALLEGDSLGALVERKTFENLLANFGVMPILHQSLAELAEHRFNALVIEAPYEDFISTGKLHHYSPTFCAAAIAELYTTHPGLRVVFCANRKTANMWTCSFFAAVAALSEAETSTIGQAKVPLVPPRSGVRGQKRRG